MNTILVKRNQSLDLIKICGMVGVVILHTTLKFDNYSDFVSKCLFSISGLAMPLFFMVSGYLMIGKSITKKYIAKKIIKIVQFVFFISLIFWGFNLYNDNYSIFALFRSFILSFFQGGHIGIFWYFGAIILCYLCLPLFNCILKSKKQSVIFLTILLVICFICFIFNITDKVESHIRQSLRLWNWFLYFFIGGVFRKVCCGIEKESGVLTIFIYGGTMFIYKLLAILFLFILLILVYSKLTPFIGKYGIEYMFGSTLWIVTSVVVFGTLINLRISDSKIINEMSTLFLPVYALHMHVIDLFQTYVDFGVFYNLAPVIELVLVILSSILLSYIIMKTPFVNRIFRL